MPVSLDLPFLYSRGPMGLELDFKFHATGGDRFKGNSIKLILGNSTHVGSFDRLPSFPIFVEYPPGSWDAAFTGACVVKPVHFGLGDCRRRWEIILDPFIGAFAGPPMEEGVFRII